MQMLMPKRMGIFLWEFYEMAIQYIFQVDGDLLRVTASGKDENLEDVKQYGQALLEAAMENNCTKALCDERDLIYNLQTFDIFNSAKYMAEIVPHLAKVAIVFNPDFSADAEFWETVAVNRGLSVSFFKDMEKATRWLKL